MDSVVLLVNPPLSSFRALTSTDFFDPQEPLGISFLAGYLRAKGICVEVLDCFDHCIREIGDYYWQGLDEGQIEAECHRRHPEIVAISSMFTVHCYAVHRVAAAAKRAVPDALVVVGGAHPSALPRLVSLDKNIDIVVVGEGELTLYEIIMRHSQHQPLYDIAGAAYTDHAGVFHAGPPRGFLNLATHPGPAHDMFDMNQYVDTDYSRRHAMHRRRAALVTSRGCPCNCVFCGVHCIWRHSYRTRKPESVLNEIEWLVAHENIGEIMFWDDNLAINRRHFEALLDGIIERRVPIRWCIPNGIAIWVLDEGLIDKCRDAGCYKLTFGIETGSAKTQKFIRKTQIDLVDSKRIIEYCNSIGIWTQSAFIIGFPFETREDIMATIDYAATCGVDAANFKVAVPYPGTDMYDIYRDNGLIPSDVECREPDRWIGNIVRASGNTCHLSCDEVESLLTLAQKTFRSHRRRKFLNPLYVANKVRNWQDATYVAKLLRLGFRQFVHR